ncbi:MULTISPECIES: lysylphosphatidylglycerol synthase transmembrane domain-containing protein [Olivibacter]|uniref:Lysylphosphatidylglycerol synthase transmembrane domain-containing protein n=1 Tax=Olivibacter oleidegradans TaxID=760123 RepID=A0ABV6HQH8_9SPHI|nr:MULTISPECIES: lysylphosphatidylglycerol synthase transmembrane domain-containing protein [Olivibacter]MDM8173859.1 lysylphosphatidylglycerol synthase transmembrane domain-containing protein [Olivibacter sp. 47]MDX3915043.1 lysylphosphatidylglycerol synthase transmembrane domain-containing protein [Pseudosphingobacterium sp.]QEL03649.1 flippase-like domain-containing protein [Olivibacter sp. LS-1]
MTKQTLWTTSKLLLKFAVTALALYLVFTKVSLNDLKEVFTKSDPLFLFLGFLSFFISIVISAWRLNTFFKGINLNLPELYNFKLYLLGMFYNISLPGGIGGDGYKIYFLRKKYQVKGRKLLSCVFFDRLSGLWALCLITAALVIFIPKLGIPNWIPIFVVIIGTIIYYLIMRRFFNDYAYSFTFKHLKALGVQSLQVICAICILYGLHFEGKFSPYLLLFLLSQIVAVIPLSIGGLGAREVVFMYGSDFFHLDSHRAILISLISYFISAIISLLGSYFTFHPKALGEEKLPETNEIDLAD